MLRAMIELLPPLASSHEARSKIAVRGLWMTFQGRGEEAAVHVLEDLNLDVRDGEFVCLVGPSGCGKSTLLNIAGGFPSTTSRWWA